MRTDDETAALQTEKDKVGYRDPPTDLVPAKGPDYNSGAWDRLHAWFESNTKDANNSILIFFALKTGLSLGEAYVYTDGWAKRRASVDDDGNYLSYN